MESYWLTGWRLVLHDEENSSDRYSNVNALNTAELHT